MSKTLRRIAFFAAAIIILSSTTISSLAGDDGEIAAAVERAKVSGAGDYQEQYCNGGWRSELWNGEEAVSPAFTVTHMHLMKMDF